MRLTLRTLLAYLDDTLEPAEIKRIGQKVAESETAQELIARIKSVTRRRRLTTPPLTGSADKFDPNTVAEYLDSMLPPDKVEEIEKICLESDVHLAEIGSCHQILTLVLGEPALVPPSAKRRMYALAGGGKPSGIRKTPKVAVAASEAHESGEDDALLLGLPALRRGSGLVWLLPVAGCLLLALLAVVIYFAVFRDTDYAQRRKTPSNAVANNTKGNPPISENDDKSKTGKNGASEADAKGKSDADKTGAAETGTGKDNSKNESGSTTTGPKNSAGSGNPPAYSPADPSTKHVALGKLIRNDTWNDLVMLNPAGSGRWQRITAGGKFSGGDTLVSLPGYQGELAFDSGVRLLLWGNVAQQLSDGPILESGVIVHAVEPDKEGGAADVDFTLSRGRVWISNRKPDDRPAFVRLRFHKEVWDLTLEKGTECCVELVGREVGLKPTQAEEGPASALVLVVKKGRLSVRDDLREFPPMTATSVFGWTNTHGAAPGPEAMPQLPAYWDQPVEMSPKVPRGQEMKRALDSLRKKLAADPESKVGASIAEALQHAEGPEGHFLAVYCLGAIDSLPDLADCLGNELYPDVRDAAIEAVRHWLGRGAGQRDRFRTALTEGNKYNTSETDTLLYLLRLPSAEDLREKDTFAIPIGELNNDKLAIRHLSFWHLLRMCNKEMRENKLMYDPTDPPERRDFNQKKWEKALQEGKLFPEQLRNMQGKQ
jgi:hypothetical protein